VTSISQGVSAASIIQVRPCTQYQGPDPNALIANGDITPVVCGGHAVWNATSFRCEEPEIGWALRVTGLQGVNGTNDTVVLGDQCGPWFGPVPPASAYLLSSSPTAYQILVANQGTGIAGIGNPPFCQGIFTSDPLQDTGIGVLCGGHGSPNTQKACVCDSTNSTGFWTLDTVTLPFMVFSYTEQYGQTGTFSVQNVTVQSCVTCNVAMMSGATLVNGCLGNVA